MTLTSTAKQVQIIARYALKRAGKLTGIVVYAVRSSNGKDTYRTTLVNGKATGCTCPARSVCYHMRDLEAKEAARPTITVGSQAVSGATPAQAVKKALALLPCEGERSAAPTAVLLLPERTESLEEEPIVLAASAAPQKREQAPHRAPSTEGRRAKSAMKLNGKSAVDCVTAYDAGWEAGKAGKYQDLKPSRNLEEMSKYWMHEMQKAGWTLRAQKELREQYAAGYQAGKDAQPAPATDTTDRMEAASLNGASQGFSLLK